MDQLLIYFAFLTPDVSDTKSDISHPNVNKITWSLEAKNHWSKFTETIIAQKVLETKGWRKFGSTNLIVANTKVDANQNLCLQPFIAKSRNCTKINRTQVFVRISVSGMCGLWSQTVLKKRDYGSTIRIAGINILNWSFCGGFGKGTVAWKEIWSLVG